MSGPDEADRDKGFLARWSQRKQEAKQPEPQPDAPAAESVESSGSPAPQGEDVTPEFDLSSLPKLEELTGNTDITAFLRKGVPEHLRNAALQKSWALDPAIRNYVNPALEYAYDWNTPGGVPGGGELGAGVDVARLVSQIMGEPAAEPINFDANSGDETARSPVEPPARDLSAKEQEDLAVQPLERSGEPAAETEAISKAESGAGEPAQTVGFQQAKPAAPQQSVRRHGTAKPIV
ncbi:DUF3306 domain-containing protein [Bradyrhizobium algeriense]|uniref:DUF3306 domain-containing protein n=1 Tax=Bradyrhizobium algeriense TaxID=634784 RepID=UPI000D36D7F6|nr:DUF3306 domain-containing protein [Bradyrhizobium algeriense]